MPALVIAAEDDTLAPYEDSRGWPVASPARGSSASTAVGTHSPNSTPALAGPSPSSSPRSAGRPAQELRTRRRRIVMNSTATRLSPLTASRPARHRSRVVYGALAAALLASILTL